VVCDESTLSEPDRREFWAICDDCYRAPSTILTSQVAATRWHEQIGDSTLADGSSLAAGNAAVSPGRRREEIF